MDKAIVYGSGGHGKVVLDILLESGFEVMGFVDDNKNQLGSVINGYPVLGDGSYLENKKKIKVALGIGCNSARENILHKLTTSNAEIISAIHPKAVISREVRLGKGIVIMAGAVVNPSTVIEDGVVVNTGATVDHDCHLAAFSHLWPGAHLAGSVYVGERSYIGMGAAVIQNIKIGRDVKIGAGAVVISDIPDNATAVGVPAKCVHGEKQHAK